MTDPLDDFVRAYDAWAASAELCAGPLFNRMLEAREAIDGSSPSVRNWGDAEKQYAQFDRDAMSDLEKLTDAINRLADTLSSKRSVMPGPVPETPISTLELTVRAENCLLCERICSVEALLAWTESDLRRIPNLGKKSLTEILAVLSTRGLSLRQIS